MVFGVPNIINNFSGEHAFLHPDYPCQITLGGKKYFCLSQALAVLSMRHNKAAGRIVELTTIDQVRSWSRGKSKRPDWIFVRRELMAILLRRKFSKRSMTEQLLATDDAMLVWGNSGGDRYFGISHGIGKNVLGWLLMELREELVKRHKKKP